MRTLTFTALLLTISLLLFLNGCRSGEEARSSDKEPASIADDQNRTIKTGSRDSKETRTSRTDNSGRKMVLVVRPLPSGNNPIPSIVKEQPECPPEETILDDTKAAEVLWDAFQSISWDQEPQGNCHNFQKDDPRWIYNQEACVRCISCKSAYQEARFYYALSPEAESCILEESHFSLHRRTGRRLSEVENLLIAQMEKNFGPADVNQESTRFPFPFTNFHKWWHTKDASTYLNLFQDEDRLILRVRHFHLQRHLAENKDLLLPEELSPLDTEASIDLALEQWLKAKYPDLSEWLGRRFERKPDGTLSPDPEKAFQILLQFLKSRKEAPKNIQPAILMACDRLTARLANSFEESSTIWPRWKAELEAYGLRFAPNHLGDCWDYDHSLLHILRKEFPENPWAEEAFLCLMRNGFQTWATCSDGPDSFRLVITKGEEFLRQNPSPEHRLEALFMLAQAYETWWSLSKASDTDDYVRRARYTEGAEDARIEAVRVYRQVKESAPDSRYARIAGRKLPRLRMRLDTNQRRFFCIYD